MRPPHQQQCDVPVCCEWWAVCRQEDACAGLCSRTIVTMEAHKSALQAVETMQKYDVSAVAVVDRAGRLIGSFSMAALRSIMLEQFGALALPVTELLTPSDGIAASPGMLSLSGIVPASPLAHSGRACALVSCSGMLCMQWLVVCWLWFVQSSAWKTRC